jgi:hypothetical protein
MIRQHCCLRSKPCSYKRTPVVRDNDTPSAALKIHVPSADDELAHSLENLIRAILLQAVTTTVSWHINRNENAILQLRRLQDVPPEQE